MSSTTNHPINMNSFNNLARDLQRQIRTLSAPNHIPFHRSGINKNCGYFLQSLQPFPPANFDHHPEAREFFRKTVLYSLKNFCKRVTTLRLYKRSSLRCFHVNDDEDEFPLVYRIRDTITDIESKPNMSGQELADKCKRIAIWKREIRGMPILFRDLLQIFKNMLSSNPTNYLAQYAGILESLKVFNLRPFHDLDGEMRFLSYPFMPEDIRQILLQKYIQMLETEMSHDNARLDFVLKPIL